MKDETSQIEQRIRRYWYSDGIGEMMGGVMFLVLAVYFSLQQYLGDESFIGGIRHVFGVIEHPPNRFGSIRLFFNQDVEESAN